MFYTISDFCHVYEDEVRLIAGWGWYDKKNRKCWYLRL